MFSADSLPVVPRKWLVHLLLGFGVLTGSAGVVAFKGWEFGWFAWAVMLGLAGCLLGSLLFVARQRRQVAALHERMRDLSELLLRREGALHRAGTGIWEYDIGREVLICDAGTRDLYDLGPGEEYRYAEWSRRLHPEDAADAHAVLRAAVANGERYLSRHRLLLRGGEVRHVRASGMRVQDTCGNARIIGVSRDVTDDVAREEMLRTRCDAAEAKLATRSRRLAMMRHEIRQPMSGVVEMLDLLQEGAPGPEQKRRAELARAAATVLGSVLDGALGLSGPEDEGKAEPVHMQIAPLLDEVVALFRPIAEARGVSAAVEISPQVPAWVACDPVWLRQIVSDLLGTAIWHAGSGQIVVTVGYASRRAELTITVEGVGIGSAPENARRIAGMLGGTVRAESDAAGLDRVVATVTVPRGREPGAVAQDQHAPQRPLSVLLVEDNQTNQLVISAMLARAGHKVSTAVNGMEAVEAVRAGGFDVVLMDVEMPVMDGTAAAGAIRAMDGPAARLPIVALTAHAMPGDRERYIGLGMSDYLAKPIDPKALAAVLARAAGPGG